MELKRGEKARQNKKKPNITDEWREKLRLISSWVPAKTRLQATC